MDWVWTNSQSKGVARLVMLAIADKAKGSTCKAFAGLTFLQERANAGRSTVVGAVRDLTDSGELEIVEGETGPYGAAVYRLPKAVGHVRMDGSTSRKSVQNLHRSTRGIRTDIGSVSAPIDGPADCEIGSESAPDGEPDTADIGTDAAPIEPMPERQISAETAPIHEPPYAEIGADSGPQSVQILDNIGAVSAPPLHQEPNTHQKPLGPADDGTLFPVDVVAVQHPAGKPRVSNPVPTAQTFIAEWLAGCAEDDQPTQTTVKRIGKELKTLIAENARPEDIRQGLADWDKDGKTPTSLPTFVDTARKRRRNAESTSLRIPRQSMSTVDQRVVGAMEAAQRLDASRRAAFAADATPLGVIASVTQLPSRGIAS